MTTNESDLAQQERQSLSAQCAGTRRVSQPSEAGILADGFNEVGNLLSFVPRHAASQRLNLWQTSFAASEQTNNQGETRAGAVGRTLRCHTKPSCLPGAIRP